MRYGPALAASSQRIKSDLKHNDNSFGLKRFKVNDRYQLQTDFSKLDDCLSLSKLESGHCQSRKKDASVNQDIKMAHKYLACLPGSRSVIKHLVER